MKRLGSVLSELGEVANGIIIIAALGLLVYAMGTTIQAADHSYKDAPVLQAQAAAMANGPWLVTDVWMTDMDNFKATVIQCGTDRIVTVSINKYRAGFADYAKLRRGDNVVFQLHERREKKNPWYVMEDFISPVKS
jgi:hypothetical protein